MRKKLLCLLMVLISIFTFTGLGACDTDGGRSSRGSSLFDSSSIINDSSSSDSSSSDSSSSDSSSSDSSSSDSSSSNSSSSNDSSSSSGEHGHNYNTLGYNESKHWYACSCGDKIEEGHTGGTATCKAKAKCSVCDQEYGALGGHNYQNNTCVTCGATVSSTDGVAYEVSDGGEYAEVVGFSGNATDVTILAVYNDLPVKKIGSFAFRDKNISSVVIPDSVTDIDSYAFFKCKLSEVVFGNNSQLNVIGNYAFRECSNLTDMDIPDSVVAIGTDAFSDCDSLESVNFGENSRLEFLNESAFRGCSSLKSIDFGSNHIMSSIDRSVFYGCTSLESVVLPSALTSINFELFRECSSLTAIVIPSKVIVIRDGAFSLCTKLTSITFQGTVAQWNTITKESGWNYNVPATKVVCSGGEVAI